MQPNNTSAPNTAPTPTPAPMTTPMNPGGDMVFKDKPKKNTGAIVGMVILALLAAGGIAFGVWAYLDGNARVAKKDEQISELNQQLNQISQSDEEEITDEETNSDSNTKYCEGKYYGETSGQSSNGLSYDYKYTYILNNDGSFTADYSGTSETEGVYMINGNTISLIGKKEITGPEDTVPSYSTKDYVIANDCSSIKVSDGEIEFDLNKQE